MSTKTKPKVGDVMWRVYSSRWHPREEAVTVTKVGRKYYTVRGVIDTETEHQIECGYERGDHALGFRVYASQQEHLNVLESIKLRGRLGTFFQRYGDWGLSLEQMRQIAAIVGVTGTEEAKR